MFRCICLSLPHPLRSSQRMEPVVPLPAPFCTRFSSVTFLGLVTFWKRCPLCANRDCGDCRSDAMVRLTAPDLPSHQGFLLLHAIMEIQFLMFLTFKSYHFHQRAATTSVSTVHYDKICVSHVLYFNTVCSDCVVCPLGSLTIELLKTIKRALLCFLLGLLLITKNNLLGSCHLSCN